MRRLLVAVTGLALCGCTQLVGLPTGDAQIRIFEGQAAIEGGNLVTPARGDATGHACIVTQIGELDAHVGYRGEWCAVELQPADAR